MKEIELKDYNIVKKLKMPLTLQLELTLRCNHSCLFCYNNSRHEIKNPIGTQNWIRLAKDVVEKEGVFRCALSGGEPLLNKPLVLKMMDILGSDGTSFEIMTNGYLLDELFLQNVEKYNIYFFQISIDSSHKETHNYLRQISDGFEKAIKSIKLLTQKKQNVVISSVINQYNINEIEEIAIMAYDLGVRSLFLSPVYPIGRAEIDSELLLDSEQLSYFYSVANSLKSQYSRVLDLRVSLDYNRYMDYLKRSFPSSLLIRPNGDVKFNCLSTTLLGNISAFSIDEIWKNAIRKELWKYA